MTVSAQNLVWIDMEMTGLDPEENVVLEIATIVTDKDLNVLAEGPVIAIHQSEEELGKMDDWNVNTHTKSGLVARVKASEYDEAKAVAETLAFIRQWVPERTSPLCGNSRVPRLWRALDAGDTPPSAPARARRPRRRKGGCPFPPPSSRPRPLGAWPASLGRPRRRRGT